MTNMERLSAVEAIRNLKHAIADLRAFGLAGSVARLAAASLAELD
jgi:hypothetical protein